MNFEDIHSGNRITLREKGILPNTTGNLMVGDLMGGTDEKYPTSIQFVATEFLNEGETYILTISGKDYQGYEMESVEKEIKCGSEEKPWDGLFQ
jgi:hypothetical protein